MMSNTIDELCTQQRVLCAALIGQSLHQLPITGKECSPVTNH